MRHPNQILTRGQILNHVWRFDFDPGSNVVDVYVGYLRRKLSAPGMPPLLQSFRGAGCRMVPAPSAEEADAAAPAQPA